MEIIRVTDKAILDELYDDWAFAIEGCVSSKKNLNDLADWMNSITSLKRKRFYVISGKVMNDVYGLSGDHAYPDDIDIVCIMHKDFVETPLFCYQRFTVGGRWFTDIVDNNKRHMLDVDNEQI